MASSKELSYEGSVSGYGDDDIRGDSKKRKFKPLSAVKKFFTKKKDKKDSVVAVKAKSTTALHSGYRTDDDDEDDDGGFRSHPKPLALAGSRSLSEDSVFSPEQRGSAAISGFPKAAVSEDCLPKSAFQSELLSKLTKRQSQYSDDYHDDGLPRSPVPPITTADVIMGGPLKKQAGPAGKTSNIRDSDQSLISVDSSENEEEELFLSKWKSSVSAKKFGSSSSSVASNNTMDTLDLNSIQKTELLVSRAAKDKIMVKPQRKTARQNRMKRENSSPLSSLPSLNEESPTKSKPDSARGSWISGSPTAKSQEKVVTPPEEKPSFSNASVSHSPPSADSKTGTIPSTGGKPNLSSIIISSKGSNSSGTPLTSPITMSPPVIVPAAAVSVTAPPPKVSTPTSPSVIFPPHKTDIVSSPTDQSLSASSPNISAAIKVAESTTSPDINGKKIEKFSFSERGEKTNLTDIPVTQLSKSQRELTENKPNIDIKSRMSQFQVPAMPLHVADSDSVLPDSLILASATDDNKTRRQIRSRTLPAAKDEQTSQKVQRSSSHRIPNSGFPVPHELFEDTIAPLTSATSTTATSLDAKKPENVKFSIDSTHMPTGEPSWMSIARKRNADQEINLESEKTETAEAAIPKVGLSTSAPKSVFTSASSYLEKKRPSVETVSYRNREMADQAAKRIESSDAKHQVVDFNSQKKRSNTDVDSVQKETFESVEISHLSSVKASRNIFDASSKSTGQKDSVHSSTSAALATSDRMKQFSSSTSGISISSSSSVKPGSNVGHDPASSTASDSTKASGGISHMRSASVKASPTKTAEATPAFKSRSGSIKGSASAFTTTESSLLSEPATYTSSKADPAFKPDNPGASTTSALPSAPHVSAHVAAPHISTHVAAQPNTSLPTQTSSVTPISFYVKPFTAYSSKPATNIASASRPANAAITPNINHPTTSTSTTNPSPMATNTNSMTSALSTASNKGIPAAKSSTSVTANISSSFASPNVSSSSSVTVSTATTPSSSSSKFLPTSRPSSVRAHQSFTTSNASKPHISHNSPCNPTSTSSSLNKSPSFKAVTISTEKVASIEKMASFEKVAPVGKAASIEKVASDKTTTDVKKPVTPAKVPAWRTHLGKEVKIEIIENSPSAAPPSSTSTNSDILRQGNKGKPFEKPKNTESSPGIGTSMETEKARRSSKVLDMVKNFQNLQAPS